MIELTLRDNATAGPAGAENKASQARSVYLGWTGMQSQTKLAPMVDKRGINRSGDRQEQDVPTVEVDATLGRMLGISDGQKVRVPSQSMLSQV